MRVLRSTLLATVAVLAFTAGTAMAAPHCGLNTGKKATGEPIEVGAVVRQTRPDDFSEERGQRVIPYG